MQSTPVMSSPPQRILMIKSHSMGIGDLLRSSAAWRAMHDRWPGVELHLLFLSKHAGYPSEALIRQHHLLTSAHFVTVREGTPQDPDALAVPWRIWLREVAQVAQRVKPDCIIDFEWSGVRTALATWVASRTTGATSWGVNQFPGRSLFYANTAKSTRHFRRRHDAKEVMDYTLRDFVVLEGMGIQRGDTAIEIQASPEAIEQVQAQWPELRSHDGLRVGVNIGCGTPGALPRQLDVPELAKTLVQYHRQHASGVRVQWVLLGAPYEAVVNQQLKQALQALMPLHELGDWLDATGQTNMQTLTALVQQCDALITSDTGTYHVGVGLRVPTFLWLNVMDHAAVHRQAWTRHAVKPTPAQGAELLHELLNMAKPEH